MRFTRWMTLSAVALAGALGMSLGIALPAGAHAIALQATESCAAGLQSVEWNLTTSNTHGSTGTITPVGPFPGTTAPTPPVSTIVGDTTEPGAFVQVFDPGQTGTVTLTVNGVWSDGFKATFSGSITLLGNCHPTIVVPPKPTPPPPVVTVQPTTTPTTIQNQLPNIPPAVNGVTQGNG